ncbi:MAG TPA: plastocyanin/azurin family copper-binding protein [Xanthomonadales bacterium]|nr:plastocyanin/azurin family copper-binding protein [Xanthomonadales bacterium]
MRTAALAGAFLLYLPLAAIAAVHEVTVGDNFFSPSELTIQVGDTVRWINAEGGPDHNVTSNTGAWAQSPTAPSFTFEVVFNSPGSFPYRCTVHPAQMTGTITVEGEASSAELAVTAFDAEDGSFAAGQEITLDTTIQNSGDGDSGAVTLDYYAMPDEQAANQSLQSAGQSGSGKSGTGLESIPDGAFLLGSANIANIGMGGSVNHQAMVEVPDTIPPGTYIIGVTLNFSDGNAADNDRTDSTAVTLLGVFVINAGLNDAWVNADAPFQGFFFTVFPDLSLFFASWFTFDSVIPDQSASAVFGAPDQRWVTASGFYSGDSVTLNAELTTGGIFNDSDPEAEQTPNYGTITIKFLNCNRAEVTYDFPSLGLSGQMILTRVVGDNIPLCQALNAELQSAQ